MYLPKTEVYTALSSIPDVKVQQASQKTEAIIPSITFFVSDNSPEYTLDNEISKQDVLITLDIWAIDSSNADALLLLAVEKMKGIGYYMNFCMDVSDPKNICHINTRFTGIK